MARPIVESTDVQSAHDHPWRSVWMSRRDRAHLRYMLGHDPDPHAREWARDLLERMAAAPDWPMPNPPPFPPADDESRPTPTSREPRHDEATCPDCRGTGDYQNVCACPRCQGAGIVPGLREARGGDGDTP